MKKSKIEPIRIPLKTEHAFIEKDYTLFKVIGAIFAIAAITIFTIG